MTFIGETFQTKIIIPGPGDELNGSRAGLHFHQCPGVTPFMRFGDLPGSPSVFEFAYEDQTYTIIDGQKQGGGAAGWNDIVSGGGSGHYVVRYDGANWRRIA